MTFRVTPAAYVGSEQTVVVAEEISIGWDATESAGWYDLTVTIDEVPGWARRLAGRLENGRPSTSDPALGTTPA